MATRPAALLPLLTQPPPADRGPATDRDLLRRFARDHDQAAFDVLVKRHAPMILGVCRRVLVDPADADDACQATFVILARKAGSTRWRPSVASWLYATARQVALNARTARARRARHEGKAVPKPPANPLAEITGEELLAILDDELGRLPERYRAPVVLCCVEGLSRDEAAHQLGVPPATLKGQLERGRKKLHDALARRGVTLGAGLLALWATNPVGAAPRALAEAIRTAVGGDVPPAVAALAEGVARNGVVVRAVLAAVGAAAVGLGLVSVRVAAEPRPPARPAEKPPPAVKVAPVEPREPGRTFTGIVSDAAGRPVRAELVFLPTGADPRVVGRTGAKGEFSVVLPPTPGGKIGHLIVSAAGYSVAGRTVWRDLPADLRFVLAKEHVVRGRVIDLQGKPVAGATVVPLVVTTAAPERVDYFLEVWSRMAPQESAFHQMRDLPDCTFDTDPRLTLPDGRRLLTATTDGQGRFALAGLGTEQVAELLVTGPGMADTHAIVVTREGFDPDPVNRAAVKARAKFMLAPNGPIPNLVRLFGPAPTFAVEPEKPIRGTVTDAATGRPRAGVRVTFQRLGEKDFALLRPHTATTDQDGKFLIRGSRRYPTYLIEAAADPDAGYEAARVTAADTAGYGPVEAALATAPRRR